MKPVAPVMTTFWFLVGVRGVDILVFGNGLSDRVLTDVFCLRESEGEEKALLRGWMGLVL